MSYNKLLADVTSLTGISEKVSSHLERLGISRVIDFLFHLPHRVMAVKRNPPINALDNGDIVLLKVHLLEIPERPLYGARSKFKILCRYDKIIIELVFFNFYPAYAIPKLNSAQQFYVYGKIQRKFGITSISHPKFIFRASPEIPGLIPVYHLTYGLVNEQLCKWTQIALDLLPKDEDLFDSEIINEIKRVSLYQALYHLHNPKSQQVIEPNSQYVERLAFDELLAHQLAIHILRNNELRDSGIAFVNDGKLVQKVTEGLPFELTNNQKQVIEEIRIDQLSSKQMMRLVQGDVGSGKTAVALIAAVNAIASGEYQVAIMAPLDILANQHFEFFKKVLDQLSIKTVLLTGKVKGKERKQVLEEIEKGQASIIIGTHALFQEQARFNQLGLIIIDEQHRFGVEQRMSLLAKGNRCDMLMLTATPIPRSLTQIIYADLDLSIISEKPPGRVPIKTSVTSMDHIDEVIESLGRIMSKGEKVYWICPLIEENAEDENWAKPISVDQRYKSLAEKFNGQVGFMHGKLLGSEKKEILDKFRDGSIKILVATTVIEVGIDIKDATVMVIENAEAYGLAQLHQLRGRVGRSNLQSYCILLYSKRCSKAGLVRLAVLRETEDGFKIADEDLRLRGGGDLVGNKQSGMPEFKICNLYYHSHLASKANEIAKQILSKVGYRFEVLDEKYKILISFYNHGEIINKMSV